MKSDNKEIREQKIKQDNQIRIGKNIRKLRMENKLEQEEVASRLQLAGIPMSRETYAKIESGIRHINASELEALKNLLNTTYDELLRHTDGEKKK